MLVKDYGAAVHGIDAILVTIEVSVDQGIGFTIVGLPDAAVKESYERVRSALKEVECEMPRRHVVINMSPADVKKEGSAYDLPIAVGLVAAIGRIDHEKAAQYLIMGELALDGTILPVRGALPMAIMARQHKFKGMILPSANASEAAVVNNLEVYGVDSLRQVLDFFAGETTLTPTIINTREEFHKARHTFYAPNLYKIAG